MSFLRQLLASLALATALGSGPAWSFEYPRDPGGTFDTVRRSGTIRAAVTENPPWIIPGSPSPGGVEARLLSEFAAELGVSVSWRGMSALRALDGLERGAVDVAIGGLDRAVVSAHPGASPTYVYFSDAVVVAALPYAPLPDDLDGLLVSVPADVFAEQALRHEGAVPVVGRSDADYVAIPASRLPALNLIPTAIELYKIERVFAVPQGENAWLMHLERFLRSRQGDIPRMLEELPP